MPNGLHVAHSRLSIANVRAALRNNASRLAYDMEINVLRLRARQRDHVSSYAVAHPRTPAARWAGHGGASKHTHARTHETTGPALASRPAPLRVLLSPHLSLVKVTLARESYTPSYFPHTDAVHAILHTGTRPRHAHAMPRSDGMRRACHAMPRQRHATYTPPTP